ncbi:M24 family metallopeptidase [Streptomyces sp. SID8382]|uniref:M24 family metallopeptidase n=1 Tax=Streptomyces malaysiensis TaxID=92644 RepID=UPI000C2CA33B|nr:Xaa-Pro peptidase family protein [Streptomyces sp. M56]AUA08294.1 putative peptidase [Streptomyces sp. M56]MYX55057.1 M24 family metallopeptidase [Streptomyces sp. SID8382]
MTASPDEISDYIAAQGADFASRAPDLPFTRGEYADRLARLRKKMADEHIDTVLLTAPDTMCWLHGFTTRWYRSHSSTKLPPVHCTVVHVDHDRIVLIETAGHEQLVRLTSCADEFIGVPDQADEPTVPDFLTVLLGELGARGRLRGRIGVERWSSVPNPAVAEMITSALTAHGATIVDASVPIRSLRRLKSREELGIIEGAAAACDAGLLHLRDHIRPGMTELQAWNLLMTGVIEAGGEPAAIHETVATGPAMPAVHALSSRRPIGRGEVFHPDAACAVDRYHARLTRPFLIGEPPVAFTRLAEVLAGSYEVMESTAKVGVPFRDVHRALRKYFAEAGIEGWAGGYELGVSLMPDWVGEFCWSSEDDSTEAVIEAGLVTNYETGAFLAMVDTVVFEDSGPRFLSSLPRTPMVVAHAG